MTTSEWMFLIAAILAVVAAVIFAPFGNYPARVTAWGKTIASTAAALIAVGLLVL